MKARARGRGAIEMAGALGAFLLLWEYGPRLVQVPAYIVPGPAAVAVRLWQTSTVQIQHLGRTAATTLIGLTLALIVGVLLALLVVYVRPVKAVLMPALAAFNSIPKIAIAPLIARPCPLPLPTSLVVKNGSNTRARTASGMPTPLSATRTSTCAPTALVEMTILPLLAEAGGNELRIFGKVRLMNALPYITDAVKVAFPLALVGSVVGEFIGGNSGVGYLILSAQFNLDTPLVFATLVSITLFTTLGIGLVSLLEDGLLHWRPSRRTR